RRVRGRAFVGLAPISMPMAWRLAEECLPQDGRAWAWNQALMDLGATTCRSADPQCGHCPMVDRCIAAPDFALGYPGRAVGRVAEGRPPERFIGSSRYRRGLVVEELRNAATPLSLAELRARLMGPPPSGTGSDPEPWLGGVIVGLERDGLARSTPAGVSLP
ncbi:MAG: A/G-specific adenine glycosylase, partial [Chloroflexi bacterium]|nr:A/G-specific adenine glycosylase [Chloroflexota bacterium]